MAADSGPLKDHRKTLLSATNGGPLPISQSRQWLATACSQRRTDSYAASGPVVALQSLAIWAGAYNELRNGPTCHPLAFPEHVTAYLNDEINHKAVHGPFVTNHLLVTLTTPALLLPDTSLTTTKE